MIRVLHIVRSYARKAPLLAAEAGALPVFLYGRGLQMVARRIREGRTADRPMAVCRYLSAPAMCKPRVD